LDDPFPERRADSGRHRHRQGAGLFARNPLRWCSLSLQSAVGGSTSTIAFRRVRGRPRSRPMRLPSRRNPPGSRPRFAQCRIAEVAKIFCRLTAYKNASNTTPSLKWFREMVSSVAPHQAVSGERRIVVRHRRIDDRNEMHGRPRRSNVTGNAAISALYHPDAANGFVGVAGKLAGETP
jgi:hypothetical protein